MQIMKSRRRFLATLSSVGAVSLVGTSFLNELKRELKN